MGVNDVPSLFAFAGTLRCPFFTSVFLVRRPNTLGILGDSFAAVLEGDSVDAFGKGLPSAICTHLAKTVRTVMSSPDWNQLVEEKCFGRPMFGFDAASSKIQRSEVS